MIWGNRTVNLLEIMIDNELKFDEHVTNICIRANGKLTVLTRMMRKYLDFSKVRLLLKSFFESRFKYCPLTWMLYSRKTNNRINKLHGRSLRLVYNDYELFEDFLTKDGSFTVHHYNIQTLPIELDKVYNNVSQTILGELFTRNNNSYYLLLSVLFCKLGLH